MVWMKVDTPNGPAIAAGDKEHMRRYDVPDDENAVMAVLSALQAYDVPVEDHMSVMVAVTAATEALRNAGVLADPKMI